MGSAATSMNSGSSAHGEARGARTQAASQRVTAVPAAQSQRNRADQSVPASGYQQNPSNLRQRSLANQVPANAGVQRGPYIPSVSIVVLLFWQKHNVTYILIFTWC